MKNRILSTGTALSALTLALTACVDEMDNATSAPPEADSNVESAFDADREGAPDEALVIFDEPDSGVVPAPEGEKWDLHGSFDMDLLRRHFDATIHMETADVRCDDALYYWLREGGYGSGPESGPTCFGEGGGRVPSEELRLIHYVCQAPNTRAQTLIMPVEVPVGTESVSAVLTPEHTTGEEWECFDFGGQVVEADQTVVDSLEC